MADTLNLIFSIIGVLLSVLIVGVLGYLFQRFRDDIKDVKADTKEIRGKVDCLDGKIIRIGTIVAVCHPDMVDPLLKPHSPRKLVVDKEFTDAIEKYINEGNDNS